MPLPADGINIAAAHIELRGGVETAVHTAALAEGYMNINACHNACKGTKKEGQLLILLNI